MSPKDDDTNGSNKENPDSGGGPNPMMMGMGMMRKMMAQMGSSDESPMAMMQRKMKRKPESQPNSDAGNPMQQTMVKCMGMCSEMLAAIHKTNSMAAFATPELRTLFDEWVESVEREALSALDQQREVNALTLASKLKISEASAIHLIARLASKGKVSLSVSAAGIK